MLTIIWIDQRRQKRHKHGFIEGDKTSAFIVPCMLLPAGELVSTSSRESEAQRERKKARKRSHGFVGTLLLNLPGLSK
jgi:hypothetical protein